MGRKIKLTVHTSKLMETPFKNVAARRSTGDNAQSVTIRVTKKISDGRNKKTKNKKKRKRLMSLNRYQQDRLGMNEILKLDFLDEILPGASARSGEHIKKLELKSKF